jgi:hypothetical protein
VPDLPDLLEIALDLSNLVGRNLILDRAFEVVGCPTELAQRAPDRTADLGHLARTEQQERHREDEDELRHSDGSEHASLRG